MKYIVFAVLLATVAAEEFYTTKYDKIDVDTVLKKPRLLDNYLRCLLDKGNCTEDGKFLKSVIPEALMTECAKCNKDQRASAEKVLRFLVKNRRPDFDALAGKYDPSGTYTNKYRERLDKL